MVHLPVSFIRLGAMAFLLGLAAACAVRQEGAPKYDMMENLTARYNIIYHGRKIIADAETSNFDAHADNYQQLLPVLIEPTEATSAANARLMDSVIGKAQNIINNKANSKYINEAYLLTGKANYLKGNYYNAVEFFTYVAETFADIPEYRQAALVWKARALMQLGDLTTAGSVLDTVFLGLESERESVGLAFATQAKYYLLMHDRESAISMLQQALEHTGHKPTKLRWHYLLGQLLQEQGRADEAYRHYTRVMRSNAPYEMSFHAGLNRVDLLTSENPTAENRVRLLRQMLRDDKNKEFRDQIYYRIAEVQYENGDLGDALANYELALRQESGNRYQVALSYLKLADHYFQEADYQRAKHYYDSVGMFLPLDFPDAGAIQRKIANLDELIAGLQTVARQDSLQHLMGLNEAGRLAAIDSLILRTYARLPKETEKGKKKNVRAFLDSPFDDVTATAVYTDNRFYFNNPDAMGMGQAEFRRRWGNRQLRDNWRFSDMAGGTASISRDSLPAVAAAGVPNADSLTADSAEWAADLRRTYLEALPDTEEKMAASHQQIHDALLNVGNIYRDDLRDNKAAARTYEELLDRYPDSKKAALIYYNLYRLYTGTEESKAKYYGDLLAQKFPDALYTRVMKDPMYLAKLEQQKEVLDKAYEQVYVRYTDQDYAGVVKEVTHLLDSREGRDETLIQLAYLRALALGRTAGLDTFENALRQIVTDFPNDSLISPLVSQHLDFIESNRDTLASRTYALAAIDENRERFVDEPSMTLWPQLVIDHGPERPRPRRELTVTAAQMGVGGKAPIGNGQDVSMRRLAGTAEVGDIGPNEYRDVVLLPDSATYYFVINVMNERVNLAPSRFGIGQFNRTRYTKSRITHQLKTVNDENQLIYIGPFDSYESVKGYESRILPMLADIMKVPSDIYNTFVITDSNFGTLSDFDKIDDYHAIYQEQKLSTPH